MTNILRPNCVHYFCKLLVAVGSYLLRDVGFDNETSTDENVTRRAHCFTKNGDGAYRTPVREPLVSSEWRTESTEWIESR